MISKKRVWTFFDQAMVSSGNFLTVLLGALYLSLNEQGILVAFMSIYFFFLILSNALIYAPFASLYSQAEDKLSYFYKLSKSYVLVNFCFVFAFILLFGFLDVASGYSVSLFAGFIFFQQLADYTRRTSYSVGESDIAGFLSFSLYAPRIGAMLIVAPDNLDDFLLVLFWSSIASVAFAAYLALIFFIKKRYEIKRFSLKEHFSFSRNIVYAAPIGWSVAYVPTLALGALVGGSALVGILGTLRSIVGLTNVFMEIVEVSSLPKLSLLFKESRFDEIYNFLFQISVFFAIFLSAFGLLTYFYYDDVATLFRPEFLGYKLIILLLILAYFFYIVGRIYVLYFRVYLNTKPEFFYALSSFVVMIFCIPLIYYMDILGAALVYCAVPLFALLVTFYKFRIHD